jgi:hypothetical protein
VWLCATRLIYFYIKKENAKALTNKRICGKIGSTVEILFLINIIDEKSILRRGEGL